MEKVLLVGLDTIVGANLAAMFAHDFEVSGVAHQRPVSMTQVRLLATGAQDHVAIQRILAQVQPSQVILCGTGSQSTWFETPQPAIEDATVARMWSELSAQRQIRFTLVSSDAIFTGPWMFHTEKSDCYCQSREAEFLRRAENDVLAAHSQALVLRTHVYGWSPFGDGWLEKSIERLAQEKPCDVDCVRHASPLPAAELACAVRAAWDQQLAGVFHVAGAERVNPAAFLQRLSDVFHLPTPVMVSRASLTVRADGFGHGESSLQTRRLRRELSLRMPSIAEGLELLYRQHLDGYRERLRCVRTQLAKVA